MHIIMTSNCYMSIISMVLSIIVIMHATKVQYIAVSV